MSEERKYFDRWATYDEMVDSWTDSDYDYKARAYTKKPVPDIATYAEVLFASYGGGSYDGDAFVLFQRDGKLYEATGGHCSCYGLEGQWKPEETTWAALAMRSRGDASWSVFLCDHEPAARAAYWALVDAAIAAESSR